MALVSNCFGCGCVTQIIREGKCLDCLAKGEPPANEQTMVKCWYRENEDGVSWISTIPIDESIADRGEATVDRGGFFVSGTVLAQRDADMNGLGAAAMKGEAAADCFQMPWLTEAEAEQTAEAIRALEAPDIAERDRDIRDGVVTEIQRILRGDTKAPEVVVYSAEMGMTSVEVADLIDEVLGKYADILEALKGRG